MRDEKNSFEIREAAKPCRELSIHEKEVILKFTKQFIKEDLKGIIYYCYKWEGTTGYLFKSILPDDLVFKILGLINEGRRICYLKSYVHYRNSVYYHVKNELLTLLRCGKRKPPLTEDSEEVLFTVSEAEVFFDEGAYAVGSEDIVETIENKELRDSLLSLFDAESEGEEIAVLERLLEGDKRNEAAETLGFSGDKITAITKRINRKIEKRFNYNL